MSKQNLRPCSSPLLFMFEHFSTHPLTAYKPRPTSNDLLRCLKTRRTTSNVSPGIRRIIRLPRPSLTNPLLDPLFPSIAFTIQPHPAKDNHPTPTSGNGNGLQQQDDPEQSGGLRASNPNAMAGAGPVILDNETANNLEQPKSREEVSLVARVSCLIIRFVV
jgi:hypothetical protein